MRQCNKIIRNADVKPGIMLIVLKNLDKTKHIPTS